MHSHPGKTEDKIVYLSHGGRKFQDQTGYSVLTLLHLLLEQGREDVIIVVYTDRPDLLPAHRLIRPMSLGPEELKKYRGPLSYVHRIKLEVLKRAESEIGLPFIYVDCDTRWVKIPDEPLRAIAGREERAEGAKQPFYMYQLDGMISPGFYPQYDRFLPTQRARLDRWKVQSAPPWPMWNSGTIGVPAGAKDVFRRALEINDGLLPYVRLRNFVEQLALNLVATADYQVRPFDDCLEHFWSNGSELPILLRRFFEALPGDLSTPALAQRCHDFPIRASDLREIQLAPANRFGRWVRKMRTSFLKRGIDLRALWLRAQQETRRRSG